MVSINDLADRAPRALTDGERLALGRHSVRWFDTPHLPHAWECGLLMEERTSTLFQGRALALERRENSSQGERSTMS